KGEGSPDAQPTCSAWRPLHLQPPDHTKPSQHRGKEDQRKKTPGRIGRVHLRARSIHAALSLRLPCHELAINRSDGDLEPATGTHPSGLNDPLAQLDFRATPGANKREGPSRVLLLPPNKGSWQVHRLPMASLRLLVDMRGCRFYFPVGGWIRQVSR